jgi:hypothetical protein
MTYVQLEKLRIRAKEYLFGLLLLLFCSTSYSQVTYPWAENVVGPSTNEIISGIETMSNDRVFLGGYAADDLTIDSLTFTGSNYAFVAVCFDYDDSLSIEWSRTITSPNNSVSLTSTAIDQDQGRIACGTFTGAQCNLVDTTLSGTSSLTASNIWIAKWDSNGVFEWARSIAGESLTDPSISADNEGNLALSFLFLTNVTIDSTTYNNSNGAQSFFGDRNEMILRLRPDGSTAWVKQVENATFFSFGLTYSQTPNRVAFDSEGAVYFASRSVDGTTIDSTSLTLSSVDYDAVIAKIDSSGVVQWLISGGAVGSTDIISGVEVFDDVLYVVGYPGLTNSTITFDSSTVTGDVYVVEVDTSGSINNLLVGTGGINGACITFDDEGNWYLFGGAVASQLNFGNLTISSSSGNPAFVVKRNTATGVWEWGEAFGISTFFYGDAAARTNNNLYLTGRYNNSITFGNTTLFSGVSTDIYIAKLSDCTQLNPAFLGSGNDTAVCANNSVVLTVDNTSGYEIQWNFNGAALPGQINPSYTATQSGDYTFTVDSAGCIATSDTITVTIGNPINVTHTNIPPACNLEDPFTLTGGSPAGGTYSGSGIVNGNQFNPALASIGSNTIWYTYTDSLGCSDSVSKTIQVNLSPSVLSNSVSLCENDDPLSLFSFLYGFPLGGTHSGPGIVGSSFVPSSVGPGTYAIQYSYNGCLANDSILVTVDSVPDVSLTAPDSACQNTTTPFLLNGSPAGGNYSWNNVSSQLFFPNLNDPGVVEATYTVTLDGCTATDTAEIFIDTVPTLSVLPVGPFCENNAVFSLDSVAQPPGGVFSLLGSNITSITPSILGPSTNNLIYTFSNVCGTYTDTQMLVINEVPAFNASIDDVDCFGDASGSISLTMTAGTAPFTFNWSNGGTGFVLNNLPAGNYTVNVSDSNGCSLQEGPFTVNEPTPLSLSFSVDSVSCNGFQDGSIAALVSGGTTPYTFAWSNAATSSSVSGLAAGAYSVTITDNNGCETTGTVNLDDPEVFAVSIQETTSIACFGDTGGALSVTPTGNNTISNLTWSTGATSTAISNLPAATYTVTATNPNGCTANASYALTEPTPITIDSSMIANASCNGGEDGALFISASGGTGGLTYVWNTGDSTQAIINLGEATYTVSITDANACSLVDSLAITAPFNVVDVVVDSLQDVSCFNAQDGFISASSTGGTAPFTYAWSTGDNSPSIGSLDSGNYAVTITDDVGCSDTLVIPIASPSPLAFEIISLQNNACQSDLNGALSTTISGGTLPYQYTWNTGAINASINNLANGTYDLTVTDSNGCVIDSTFHIVAIDSIAPTLLINNITLALDQTGNASLDFASIDAGSSDNCGIVSTWLSQTTFNCSNVGSNSIQVAATDSSSNTDTTSVTVTVIDTIAPDMLTQNLTLYLDASGVVNLSVAQVDAGSSDSCGIDSLFLDQTSFDCNDLGSNTVQLTATDLNGNSASASAAITVLDTITPTVLAQNPVVYLDATGNVIVSAAQVDAGSSDNCSFTLSLNDSLFSCADTGSNTVILTATDNSGNSQSTSGIVTVLDTIAPALNTQSDTVYLDSNGQASITAAQVDNGSSDNCSLTLTLSDTLFDCSALGINSVIVTATDPSGNISQATVNILVLDTIAPVAQAQSVTLYLDADGSTVLNANALNAGSTDNCGIDSLVVDQTAFDCTDIGQQNVLLNVFDASGNSSSANTLITIIDSLAPSVSANDITVYLDATGSASVSVAEVDNGSTDNCSLELSLSQTDFTCADERRVIVALIGEDSSGNVAVDSFTVEVVDTIWNISAINGAGATPQGSNEVYFVDSLAGASYTWTVSNGSFVSNGAGAVVTWSNDSLTGQITVIQTVEVGCVDSTSLDIDLWLIGQRESLMVADITLFPNPARDELFIRLNGGMMKDASIKVYSAQGQMVYQEEGIQLGDGSHRMDLYGLAAGTYTVAVNHRGSMQFFRIVVQ